MIKFIFLAHPRTGTTLISNSFVDHPEILLYGELFHKSGLRRKDEAQRETMGAGVFRKLEYGIPACSEDEDGYEYLERLYSQNVPFRAIGFKLLNQHAGNGPNASVWKFLDKHPEIKIIHIIRQNLLEIITSHARAHNSRTWHVAESEKTDPFELPVSYCEENFNVLENTYNAHQSLINSRPVLSLDYEQISGNFHECMDKVCTFLEIDRNIKFTPHLKKIANLEPSKEISNYQELKSYFENTRFGKYFTW